MIEIKKFRRYADIEEIWAKLYKPQRQTFFQSPEYTKIVSSKIGIYSLILRRTPVFYVFYENSEPFLIIPLLKKWFANNYTLWGNKSGCGYLDFIFNDNVDDKLLGECLALLSEKYGVSNISYSKIKEDSILGQYLLSNTETIKYPCTFIPIPDD